MIIVDDCSTDDTCNIVTQRMQADQRIQLIKLSSNQGPAVARNTALHAAKGRYIAILDSDDLWLPEKLERQLVFMAEKGAAMSYTLYRRFFEDSSTPGAVISLQSSFNYRQLLKNTGIACLTVIIDTKITGRIEMQPVRHEDYALWLKLLKRGIVAQGLMEDLARYRISKASVSGSKLKSVSWVWRIYRDIEKLSMPYAAWCLLNYGWHAYRKHKT
jgi:teichuronic acid biosynthesis glycosyltransferase TuaG